MNNKTADSYLKLAMFFYKKNGLTEDNISPKKITDALINCASEYRPAYWRKLRNALQYDQERQGFKHTGKRIKATKNPLTKPNAPVMLKRQIKPKQKRVKSVSENDLEKLNDKIKDNSDSEVNSAVRLAFLTGCRPTEMLGIKIISPTEIFITGAKKNEKGDRGIDRYLKLDSDGVRHIELHVNNLIKAESEGRAKGLQTDVIHRIQSRLGTIAKSAFPKRKSHISLYSFRHQMGSNLKASKLDRVTIAYMMGHQSTASIDVYGDKRKASGKIAVSPARTLEEQKAVVKIKHEKPLSAQVKSAPEHQKSKENDGGFNY